MPGATVAGTIAIAGIAVAAGTIVASLVRFDRTAMALSETPVTAVRCSMPDIAADDPEIAVGIVVAITSDFSTWWLTDMGGAYLRAGAGQADYPPEIERKSGGHACAFSFHRSHFR